MVVSTTRSCWPDVTLNLQTTPWSVRGSWLALLADAQGTKLDVHFARRRFGEDLMWELRFHVAGEPARFTAIATPSQIKLETGDGRHALLSMNGDSELFIETRGLDWSLTLPRHFGYGIRERDRRFKILSSTAHNYTTVDVARGQCTLSGPPETLPTGHVRSRDSDVHVICENGESLGRLRVAMFEPDPARALPEASAAESARLWAELSWDSFVSRVPEVRSLRDEHALRAWHALWSGYVPAGDTFTHDAILMSKTFMCSVWSWDHCFNAMALSLLDRDAALEQFLLPFAHQAPSGALPDSILAGQETIWAVTKAPIHGWCFGLLLDRHAFDREMLEYVYQHLTQWTEFWLKYRDSDEDGIPEITMGCDVWDNATLVDLAFFLETPDLSANLVLQMDVLARLAGELGRGTQRDQWRQRADTLLRRLIEHSWDGDRFVAKRSGTHEFVSQPTSLLALMPIVLGSRLPREYLDPLVHRLENQFLTPHGLATEWPGSSLYQDDGYWRGSMWAPVHVLLVDGLRRAGERALARAVAQRFCRTVETSGGFFECFDARTGRGQRAAGYTWTASAYLILRNSLEEI